MLKKLQITAWVFIYDELVLRKTKKTCTEKLPPESLDVALDQFYGEIHEKWLKL